MKSHALSFLPALLLWAAAPLACHAAWVTFPDADGWNEDIIYNSSESGLPITASMDGGPGSTAETSFYSVGSSGALPGTGLPRYYSVVPSLTGSGASFQLQDDVHAFNAVLLSPGETGTLELATPTSLSTLALYGCCGHGDIDGSITIHYADGTSQSFDLGALSHDWFYNTESVALYANGRKWENGNYEIDSQNPRIYEQLYTTNTTSPVVSVDITDIDRHGAGAGGYLAVMAISGDTTVPEPSAALFILAAGLPVLRRRRRH